MMIIGGIRNDKKRNKVDYCAYFEIRNICKGCITIEKIEDRNSSLSYHLWIAWYWSSESSPLTLYKFRTITGEIKLLKQVI